MTVKIKIDIDKMSDFQQRVFLDNHRFRVMVAGRRVGKTYIMLMALLLTAIRKDGAKVWYVSPTYRQSKMVAWEILKSIIPSRIVKKILETELKIVFINGSHIALKGADKSDRLRGPGLDAIALDEFAMWDDPSAWHEVLRPTLADTGGWLIVGSTPKAYNHLYDMALKGWSDDFPDWMTFHATTREGGRVSDEEIEILKSELDERVFNQEVLAMFEVIQGRVYYKFDRKENVKDDLSKPTTEILIGMDFNIDPMSAVVAVASGDQCHIIDEISLSSSNTESMGKEVAKRYGRLLPADHRRIGCNVDVSHITIFPDPAGKARHTSSGAHITDITILKRMGFKVKCLSRAPMIMDRVNSVNAMIESADGVRRLYISTKCKKLIACLEGLEYAGNLPDKTRGLDHLPDALGYMIWTRFNLLKPAYKIVDLVA